MKYAIAKQPPDQYQFERAIERLREIEEDQGLLIKATIGFLVGSYEKIASKWWNKLTGKKFKNETDPKYWQTGGTTRLNAGLIRLFRDFNVYEALKYSYDLEQSIKDIEIMDEFINAITTQDVTIIYLNQNQFNVIFN